MQLSTLRGIKVDKEIMRKRQIEAQIEGIVFNSIEEAKVALHKARENWEIVKSKGGELRGKELLDYHPVKLNKEDENYQKNKTNI